MIRWEKTATEIDGGNKTIRYDSPDTPLIIESRRREIPHANGIGTWQYTEYFLIYPDGEEIKYHRMKEAKTSAELWTDDWLDWLERMPDAQTALERGGEDMATTAVNNEEQIMNQWR